MPFSSVLGAQSIVKPGVCTSATRPAVPYDGQVVYLTDTDQTIVWDGTQWTVLAPIAGNRNALINGAFNVWQRGTSFNGSSPYYGADRWFFARPGAVAGSTLSRQSSGLTGFTYCARMQRDSGNTNLSSVRIFQSLETINSLQFAGKQVTVSFYIRSGANYSGGATTYLNIGSGTGTDQQLGNTGFTGYSLVGQLATITPTSTWTRYSVSGSVSSSATQVGIDLGYTPTGTAGASDFIEITGVQLEAGAVATPFEFEEYQVTLAKCQRYYYRVAGGYFGTGMAFSTSGNIINVKFPITMRVIPSAVETNGTASTYSQVLNNTGTQVCNTVPTFGSIGNVDTIAVTSTSASTGLTAGHSTFILSNNGLSFLGFSAEM